MKKHRKTRKKLVGLDKVLNLVSNKLDSASSFAAKSVKKIRRKISRAFKARPMSESMQTKAALAERRMTSSLPPPYVSGMQTREYVNCFTRESSRLGKHRAHKACLAAAFDFGPEATRMNNARSKNKRRKSRRKARRVS